MAAEWPHRDDCWHVTSSLNRSSIMEHGLDWRRMGVTGGIATGHGLGKRPEAEGIFLCDLGSVDFFVSFGGHPLVDVWEVDVRGLPLEDWPDGWMICRTPIEPGRLWLAQRDVPPPAHRNC